MKLSEIAAGRELSVTNVDDFIWDAINAGATELVVTGHEMRAIVAYMMCNMPDNEAVARIMFSGLQVIFGVPLRLDIQENKKKI